MEFIVCGFCTKNFCNIRKKYLNAQQIGQKTIVSEFYPQHLLSFVQNDKETHSSFIAYVHNFFCYSSTLVDFLFYLCSRVMPKNRHGIRKRKIVNYILPWLIQSTFS